MKKLFLSLIVFILIVCPSVGIAATYYATQAGTGARDGSGWDDAWGEAELEGAAGTAALANGSSEDIVYMGGAWNWTDAAQGLDPSNITGRTAYVIFDGGASGHEATLQHTSDAYYPVYIEDVSYIHFRNFTLDCDLIGNGEGYCRGFHIQDSDGIGETESCDHIKLENIVTPTDYPRFMQAIYVRGASYVYLYDNWIRSGTMVEPGGGNYGGCDAETASSGQDLIRITNSSQYVYIYRNYLSGSHHANLGVGYSDFHESSGTWTAATKYIYVYNNHIQVRPDQAYGYTMGMYGSCGAGNCLWPSANNVQYVYIHHNWFEDARALITLRGSNVYFHNNIIDKAHNCSGDEAEIGADNLETCDSDTEGPTLSACFGYPATLSFDGGTNEPSINDYIVGVTSGATAKVVGVKLRTAENCAASGRPWTCCTDWQVGASCDPGSWAGNDAVGYLVLDDESYDYTNGGFDNDLFSDNETITNTTQSNTIGTAMKGSGDGVSDYIRNLRVGEYYQGTGFPLGVADYTDMGMKDIYIINNTIYSGSEMGLKIDRGSGGETWDEIHTSNNLWYEMNRDIPYDAASGCADHWIWWEDTSGSPGFPTTWSLKNNLIYNTSTNDSYRELEILEPGASCGTGDGKDITAFEAAHSESSGNVNANPLLTDPANNNFTLGTGSAAVGAGLDANDTYTGADQPDPSADCNEAATNCEGGYDQAWYGSTMPGYKSSVIIVDRDTVGWDIGAVGSPKDSVKSLVMLHGDNSKNLNAAQQAAIAANHDWVFSSQGNFGSGNKATAYVHRCHESTQSSPEDILAGGFHLCGRFCCTMAVRGTEYGRCR